RGAARALSLSFAAWFIQHGQFAVVFSYSFLDLFFTHVRSSTTHQNNIFKNVDMYSVLVSMSATIAQARVKRLVNLGLVNSNCTPNGRITQLKSRISEDDIAFRELKTFFSALG